MYCASCGYKNRDEANYCEHCGESLHFDSTHGKTMFQKFLVVVLLFGTSLLIIAALGLWQLHKLQLERIGELVQESSETKSKTEMIKASQRKVYTINTDAAYGSGFLYTDSGAVVTSAHLVVGFYKVLVRDYKGNEEVGRVIGVSEVSDIALIQVDALGGEEPLTVSKEPADVGTEVIALGSPSGFENTAAIGYLTGLDRDFDQDFLYEDLYQIDVQMALGSSGGPLIHAETGRVIGINSLLLIESDGIGFSIPIHSVDSQLKEWAENPMSESQVMEVYEAYDEGLEFHGSNTIIEKRLNLLFQQKTLIANSQ